MATMTDTLAPMTGADLIAGTDPSIFEGLTDGPSGPDVFEGSEDSTPEPEVSLEPEASDEHAATTEPELDLVGESDEQPAIAEPKKEAAATEPELPEGVEKGKNAAGKDGMWLKPNRYQQFHEAHKARQAIEQMLGEPLVAEQAEDGTITYPALDVRNRAYMGQERLYRDLVSGDPAAQANLIGHFLQEAQRAKEMGEVGADPMIPFAETFYSQVQQQHPEAYAAIRRQAAKDLQAEMYDEAARTGDRNLWLSVGHVAKKLGMPFRPEAEMATYASQPDQSSVLAARVQQLEQQITGQQVGQQEAAFNQWKTQTAQSVQKSLVDEAINPSLGESARKAWEKFPDVYQAQVVNVLDAKIRETLNRDTAFNERIALLDRAAKQATSAQKRADIGNQIRQAYVNRAKLVVDANKRDVLNNAAKLVQQKSDATHQRKQSAQQQRSPTGDPTTVQRSLVPKNFGKMGDTFDSTAAVRDLAAFFK